MKDPFNVAIPIPLFNSQNNLSFIIHRSPFVIPTQAGIQNNAPSKVEGIPLDRRNDMVGCYFISSV
jgi:hypothetical protein